MDVKRLVSWSRLDFGVVIPGRGRVFAHASPESILVSMMAAYVYMLASRRNGTLYIGVTRDLIRRIFQHRTHMVDGFTSRYDITRLVWFEIYEDIATAIAREKELKKWRRAWKIRLIEEQNPDWADLYPDIAR